MSRNAPIIDRVTPTEALGSQQRAPSETQLRSFGLLSALYLVIAAAVVPWAAVPGPAEAEIIAVYGIAILVAELCTAALLVLACAYLYSSLMAGARVAAYPGARRFASEAAARYGLTVAMMNERRGVVK